MESTRQHKFSRLIQKEIADIFLREGRGLIPNAMITVTEVRVSPDLSVAKIYVSLFPPNTRDAAFESLQHHVSEIRKHLGTRIRHQARVTPELVFFLDNSLDEADRIERLLKK